MGSYSLFGSRLLLGFFVSPSFATTRSLLASPRGFVLSSCVYAFTRTQLHYLTPNIAKHNFETQLFPDHFSSKLKVCFVQFEFRIGCVSVWVSLVGICSSCFTFTYVSCSCGAEKFQLESALRHCRSMRDGWCLEKVWNRAVSALPRSSRQEFKRPHHVFFLV